MSNKLKVQETMSGFAVLRRIEDHLAENNPDLCSKFFWRAKQETEIFSNNENSAGWAGHDLKKILVLAKEFGVEVEIEK